MDLVRDLTRWLRVMVSPERSNHVSVRAGVWIENRTEEVQAPVEREESIAGHLERIKIMKHRRRKRGGEGATRPPQVSSWGASPPQLYPLFT